MIDAEFISTPSIFVVADEEVGGVFDFSCAYHFKVGSDFEENGFIIATDDEWSS